MKKSRKEKKNLKRYIGINLHTNCFMACICGGCCTGKFGVIGHSVNKRQE